MERVQMIREHEIVNVEFEELSKEFEGTMVNTIRRIFPEKVATTKSGVLSFEDLMQEARLALLEAKQRYRPDKNMSFKSYFILVLRSTLLMIYARRPKEQEKWIKQRFEYTKSDEALPVDVEDPNCFVNDVACELLRERIGKILHKHLVYKDACYAEYIIMLKERGYTFEEIGEILDVSVYSLWEKAKKVLKKYLPLQYNV
ncbi:MAG TPA: sigma-70 family RNA polymerase sigma factor [Methanofastidiosum sp.]|nr:sigma-70 family RNA polymerase sigma factor [Methanofastidiosum sp.]